MVKSSEDFLNVVELCLCRLDRLSQSFQALFVILLVELACFVFPCSKVLDLFAAILYFCEAEGGRRAFEEVAESGKLIKVFFFAGGAR